MRRIATIVTVASLFGCTGTSGSPALALVDRTPTPEVWVATAVIPHCDGCTPEPAALALTREPLTPEEQGWRDTILARGARWEAMTHTLAGPFPSVHPPERFNVEVGKGAADDAFICGLDRICLDLEALTRIYGEITTAENQARMDRLFAHEYTHLLHKRWLAAHPQPAATPLDRALLDAAAEGIGNYRSLSLQWVDASGALTPMAEATLAELGPIFTDRMSRLATADTSQEAELRRGLSSGPFRRKWGAVPVALWLAKEAQGDDRRLAPWVEKGSAGVLELARKHLPQELAARLPARP